MGKSSLIRAITVGNNIEPSDCDARVFELNRFLHLAKERFEQENLGVRSLRACSQPLEQALVQKKLAKNPEWLAEYAKNIESCIDPETWFCIPLPKMDSPSALLDSLEAVPKMLENTKNIFTNSIVSSKKGVNIAAIKKAAQTVKKISRGKNCFNGWRFGVVANTPPNTPYFPAAFHEGKKGFSVALELSELALENFVKPVLFEAKLEDFRKSVQKIAQKVNLVCLELESQTGFEFKGIDLSLAPFPGENSSVVKSLELLGGSKTGTLPFLFSVFAVNDLLKNGINGFKKTGYNGTMLSVLEDSALAALPPEEQTHVKDLLLYSAVCGCGVDMVPVPGNISEKQLSSIIISVCTLSLKWNKPLLTRIIPVAGKNAGENTDFSGEFFSNAKILELNENPNNDYLPVFFSPHSFEDRHNYELSALNYEAVEAAAPQEKAMIKAGIKELSVIMGADSRKKVLDLCCGTGAFIGEFIEKLPLSRSVGVDVNMSFLELAREKFRDLPVSFEHADAVNWKSNKKFDVVLLSSAYHHIEDERKVDFLKNVAGHLNENGFAVFAENILPEYKNVVERQQAVREFYGKRAEDAKRTGILPEEIKRLERIVRFELDREYEYKVDLPRFKNHLKKAGLKVVLKKRVWGKKPFFWYRRRLCNNCNEGEKMKICLIQLPTLALKLRGYSDAPFFLNNVYSKVIPASLLRVASIIKMS
jgi:SAM-dependent methyltransferase